MLAERSQNEHAALVPENLLPVWQLTVHNLGRTDINRYTQDAYRMRNA